MKPRSFAWRIALLTTLVSGVVLVTVGALAWLLVNNINVARIDNELKMRTLPQLFAARGGSRWERLESFLDYTYAHRSSDSDESAFFVLAKDRQGRVVHKSSSWPDELSAEQFPKAGQGKMIMLSQRRPPPGIPRQVLRTLQTAPGSPDSRRPRRPRTTKLRRPEFFTRRIGGCLWRVGILGNEHHTVVIGVDLAEHAQHMQRVRAALLMILPAALLLIAGGAWLISQRALRPVGALARTAESITARGLHERIQVQEADAEFARLVTVFNEMMQRLERSFHQATRFSADAAHELKTPLTILQGELEQALQEAETGSRQQQVYSGLLEEVQRLKGIVRKLLLLSRADAGRLELNLQPVDLTALVEAVCEDAEILATGLTLNRDFAHGMRVLADAGLLEQVLQNLMSNAVRHTPPDGEITVHLREHDSVVALTVANTGDGIAPEDRQRVFDRFWRADKSRGRHVDGVGLGLSLSREIATAHHGRLVLEQTPPGITAFTLSLPAAPTEQ